MILLDTNIVSEMTKDRSARHPAIEAFMRAWPVDEFYLPSVVLAELRYGIVRLPVGRKRSGLEAALEIFLRRGFDGKVLGFDASCAQPYGEVRAARERMGRPVSIVDAMIGGMALAHGAALASRNVTEFDGYGLRLINPWDI